MNDDMRSGHHRGGQVTGEALRRLIEEGARAGGAHGYERPTDAALRDLAAVLNIASWASASPPPERAAQEAAAMAAFRDARTKATPVGRMRRRALRDHLSRARSAVLAGVTAAVLGGGAAVAAAGGDIPFVGGDADGTASPSAPASDDAAPDSPGTSALPGEQAQPAPAATPPATAPDADEDTGGGPGGSSPGAPDGNTDAGTDTADKASEKALRSLCTARARNPHLTPRALVAAAGSRDRIRPYCEALLSESAGGADSGSRGGEDGTGPHLSATGDADGTDDAGETSDAEGDAEGTAESAEGGADGSVKGRS